MRKWYGVALAVVCVAQPARAQTEEQLRNFFEGRSVVVKLEMPGTEDGVDVYPGTDRVIDYPKHAARLKRFGTALRRGDEVTITKVKLKKDLIEFQLGGGGYGTFGDDASADVHVPTADKTEREKNLEKDLDKTKDEAQRRKIKEELDGLRKAREREDARNRARAEEARQIKEANIRQRRTEGGSRFNIRYERVVPAAAATPEGVMAALAEFVDFTPMSGVRASGQPSRPGELRKGMTVDDVDALLGRPVSISQRMEGTLTVNTSVYQAGGRRITAEFVEGVLVRFRAE